MSQKVIGKTSDGSIIYSRPNFNLNPFFYFPALPQDHNRFSILVIAPPDSVELNGLLKLLLNSHIDSNVINVSNLYQAKTMFCDYNKSIDDLKAQIGIFDLSTNNEFSKLHPSIIPAHVNNILDKYHIRNILIPNILLQNESDNYKKNYSHTIWFASNVADIPRIVISSSQLCFVFGLDNINQILKSKLGVNQQVNFPDKDIILVISLTLTNDVKLMMLSRKRFQD